MRVEAIYIADDAGSPMTEKNSVLAMADFGLEGDRYAKNKGCLTAHPSQLTLIDVEEIEAANGEADIAYVAADTRRNIVTSGMDEFFCSFMESLPEVHLEIGKAAIRCYEPCRSCGRPGALSGKPGFATYFDRRGGVRASITKSGLITVGDEIIIVKRRE